jgi:hypothetical protein
MIEVEKASGFPVSIACELLGVSHSGYHGWETPLTVGPGAQRGVADHALDAVQC